MSFPWEKQGPDNQVIALRTARRSVRKDGQTQSNSGLSAIGEDVSVPPTGSTRNPQSNYCRAASDTAQLFLPTVAAIVGPVPLAGPPLQAAINGLLGILQIIDRNKQNKKDLASLESRLYRLSRHLCNAPTAGDPGEQSLRDSLTSMLQETSSKLKNLHKRGIRSTSSVARAITGCSSDINDYLLEYSVFAHMQTGHEVHAIFTAMQGTQLLGTSTLGVVTLVDATGYEHALLVEYCTSFQQLTMMLGVVFESNSIQARVQRQYLERGQYNLSIDHNTEVTQLTSDDWPSIEPGTKIVMSIVVKQQQERTESYQCYLCKTWNSVSSGNQGRTRLIDCRGCRKRFQVSDTDGHGEDIEDGEVKENLETTAEDRKLIQNWHLQNEEMHDRSQEEEESEESERRSSVAAGVEKVSRRGERRGERIVFRPRRTVYSDNKPMREDQEHHSSHFEDHRDPSRTTSPLRKSRMPAVVRKIVKVLRF